MSTKAVRPTNEWVLLARQKHPGEKGRKLARRFAPTADERELVRLASAINRVLRKFPADVEDHRSEAPPEPQAIPNQSTDGATDPDADPRTAEDDYLEQLVDDLADARGDMRAMRGANVFGPIPPLLKKVRDMEAEVTSIRKAKEQTHASDIDTDFVVAELRKLPRAVLDAALATD